MATETQAQAWSAPGGQHTPCDQCGGLYLYLWCLASGKLECGRCWTKRLNAHRLTPPSERITP